MHRPDSGQVMALQQVLRNIKWQCHDAITNNTLLRKQSLTQNDMLLACYVSVCTYNLSLFRAGLCFGVENAKSELGMCMYEIDGPHGQGPHFSLNPESSSSLRSVSASPVCTQEKLTGRVSRRGPMRGRAPK